LGRWDFGKFRIRNDYAVSYIDGSFRAGNSTKIMTSNANHSLTTKITKYHEGYLKKNFVVLRALRGKMRQLFFYCF